MDVNSHPKKHEIADPSETDKACVSRNHLSLNSMNLVSKDTEQYREGKNSSFQTMKKIVQEIRANKKSRQDITKKTDSNRYLKHEASVAANRMPLGKSQSFEIRKELLNIDFKGNMGQLNGSPKDDVLVQEALINNKRQWNRRDNICSSTDSKDTHFSPLVEDSRGFNTLRTSRNHSDQYSAAIDSSNPSHNRKKSASYTISTNKTNQDDKIFKSEIFSKRGQDGSAESHQSIDYDKTLEFNITRQIAFHNISEADIVRKRIKSHHDFSRTTRNDKESYCISDAAASNRVCYSDGKFAASGLSGHQRNEIIPPVVGEMVQSSNTGDIKSFNNEEIKALVCRTCKVEIVQNETQNNDLISIDSLFSNFEGSNLQIHRSTHIPKKTCTICGKKHAVDNSHKSEHRCPDPECEKTFPCRTRFYQHIPDHEKYFKKHCWVCGRTFDEHITDNDSIYICCVCGALHNLLGNFKNHNRLHLPRCFCIFCKKEYHVDEKRFHANEIKCCVCNCTFKCQIQLEEHLEDHVKNFSDFCKVSESNEKNPSCRWTFQGDFQFYSELNFKNQLYSISGLKYFKCDQCGRLFSTINGRNAHSQFCKALPYKCEICETRFLTIDLLHSHGLMKHADRKE